LNKITRESSWPEEVHRGKLRLLVLMLLARKAMYGYEIMNELDQRTLGLWRPTAGGMYPLLKRMEKKGEIEAKCSVSSGRRRRIYQITSEGKSKLNGVLNKHKLLIDTMDGMYADLMSDVQDAKRRSSELSPFSLFREVFSISGPTARTAEEEKKLLLSIQRHLKTIESKVNARIKEINEKLRQKRQAN
jgi:DNA-binding PadR family transcriptional regulator